MRQFFFLQAICGQNCICKTPICNLSSFSKTVHYELQEN